VDQHFFPEYSDRKPTLEQLGKTMVHTPDPHQFNLLVLDNIHALLRPIKSLFFVLDACEHRFKMIAAREWGVHLPVESPITLDKDHSVVHYLSNYRFLYLNEIISDRSLALWLLQQKVSLGIPVKVGGELKAFFLLGDKESGLPYSMQDIKDLCQIAGLMAVVAKSDELAQMQVTLQKLVDARSQQLREIQDELVQKERLAAIGSLAGEVSHELRNPLQVIGNARYILEKRLNKTTDPKVRSQIQMLKSQVSSMSRIIGNMLDFTRNRRLILETCSIHELLREVVHLVEVPSNIKVRFKFSSIIPEVTVDVQEFRQALINLMTNACEAMSQGGALTIETQLLHEDHMEIKIKDTGCGIPPEYLNRLFEPFSTTKVRGNGLGMAVVKKVINQHHGTIEVESTVGEGTCFIIQQPIKVTETEEDLPVHKIYNGLV
jgi:signal transduction histidine kinase